MTGSAASASARLPRFILLFAALYAAYGAESAYLPGFLASRGLEATDLGFVLAAGTLVRIVAGPLIGRLADRRSAPRVVLTVAAIGAAAIGASYLLAFGFWPLLAIGAMHAVAIAPLAPLVDTLAVAAAVGIGGFSYGWVRGAGSAAFVAGTLLSGQLVGRFGLASIIVTSSLLFVATAGVAFGARDGTGTAAAGGGAAPVRNAARRLFGVAVYRRMLVVAALVIGSHAMNDAFAVIIWREAGLDGTAISLLWSVSVVAEVIVFLGAGPSLLARFGPAGAAACAAAAGVLRWTGAGLTTTIPTLGLLQLLHGLTFALMHLVAMRTIGRSVPDDVSATAQAVYGTFALGLASAAFTVLSGYLYAWFGLRGFWGMAGLCGLGLIASAGLRDTPVEPAPGGLRAALLDREGRG